MFRWFKKNNNPINLQDWNIDPGRGFRAIHNIDSLQYANKDESIVIYFSVLVVSGGPITGPLYGEEPVITKTDDGWQLKGIKKAPDRVLICLVSFTQEQQTDWVQDFFNRVSYRD